MIAIQPVAILNQTAVAIELSDVKINLGVSAKCTYTLLSDAGVGLLRGEVEMTPAQYVNWGTDDTYPVQCFLSNLGLVGV